MRRREFLAGLGAGWVETTWAQAVPVIGFLSGRSQDEASGDTAAFLQGLKEMGYTAGRNVALEYRWAEGRNELLPDLAADLVRRQVAVLAAVGGNNSALAAKRLTATIPIVFTSSADPVLVALVASLSHPGGNVTGVSWFDAELGPKQLKLLSELVPDVKVVVLIVNPQSPEVAHQWDTAQHAARALGWQLHVIAASTESEIDAALAAAKRQGANAVMIGSDPFLHSRRKQIVSLAAHHAIPTISGGREWVAAGGLVSYGNSIPDAYRRAGLLTGRLLRGVQRSRGREEHANPPRLGKGFLERLKFLRHQLGKERRAQQSTKLARIGFLGPAPAANFAPRVDALRLGFRELGYTEGKDLTFSFRWWEAADQLPELAAELVPWMDAWCSPPR